MLSWNFGIQAWDLPRPFDTCAFTADVKACLFVSDSLESRDAHLVIERLIRKGNISGGASRRPALLLGCQAVALVLRTLGVLAGLAVAVQPIFVHPVSREVL